MLSAVLSVILTVVLMAGGVAYPEAIAYAGNKRTKKLTDIAKEIYTQIAKDSRLLEKLADAWSQKDANYMTELMQGAGFGPRSEAIKQAKQAAKQEYLKEKEIVSQRVTNNQNKYNEATTAAYNTGTISGIKQADALIEGLNQSINGGSQEQKDTVKGDTVRGQIL